MRITKGSVFTSPKSLQIMCDSWSPTEAMTRVVVIHQVVMELVVAVKIEALANKTEVMVIHSLAMANP